MCEGPREDQGFGSPGASNTPELPAEFDVVILGTGLPQSVVSAACSRADKRVLHLESGQSYGGPWATLNWSWLQKWIQDPHSVNGDRLVTHITQKVFLPEKPPQETSSDPNEIDTVSDSVTEGGASASGGASAAEGQEDRNSDKPQESQETETTNTADKIENVRSKQTWSQEQIQREGRKFNIELWPQVLYASGKTVELLISSNVARYMEFKAISRILSAEEKGSEQLTIVPCSRSDVFTAKNISVLEKRMLTKFLEHISTNTPGSQKQKAPDGNQDGASAESKTDQTFQQFLASEKLSRKLVHFLFHVISMSDDSESTSLSVEEGLKRIREFIRGIGRYKNRTPFLWPLYGSGEMPQAFCRLSAVFGGIFVLGKTPEAIVVKRCVDGRQQVTAVRVQGQEISCQHLVLAPEQLPLRIVEVQENGTTEEGSFLAAGSKETSGISRAMFLFDRPVIHSKRDEVTLVRLSTSKGMVNALELGSLSSVVPDGLVLLQLSMVTPTSSSVEEDLEESIRILTQQPGDERKPLWSLFFRRSVKEPPSTAITGIHILRPVELGIHVDPVIEEARRVFSCVYPDEEFLPRAPDPDEIILFPASEGDEGSNAGVAEKQEESTTTPEQQNVEFGPEVPEG